MTNAAVHILRSMNNLIELLLSFYHVSPKKLAQVIRLLSFSFTCQAATLTPVCSFPLWYEWRLASFPPLILCKHMSASAASATTAISFFSGLYVIGNCQ